MSVKQERSEHGVAGLETKGGDPVVAFDAVAKVAGVSGGAVAKVFAALDLIGCYTGRSVDELVGFYDFPMAAADDVRHQYTLRFARELASSGFGDSDLAMYLKLRDRVLWRLRDDY